MATSFVSEHTAEYLLVPRLIDILGQRFAKVVPFYFLSTREGSRISRQCDQSRPIRVLNVFARRPKVYAPHEPRIEVKLNSTLFDKAGLAARAGIPTFAGVPLVSSLMEFGLDAPCAWFYLPGDSDVDVYYNLLLDGTVEERSHQSAAVAGPLQEQEMVEIVLKRSRQMTWSEAIDHLRLIRLSTSGDRYYRFIFGGGYHPFTLLLIDEDTAEKS